MLAAADAEPRFGFVALLDPDDETLESPAALPEHWATFVLAPVRGKTVLEILAGPSAATYVFASDIEATNRDLQVLHFRRAPLALSNEDARLTRDNPLVSRFARSSRSAGCAGARPRVSCTTNDGPTRFGPQSGSRRSSLLSRGAVGREQRVDEMRRCGCRD